MQYNLFDDGPELITPETALQDPGQLYELFDARNMRVMSWPAPRLMTAAQLERSNEHYRSAGGVWRLAQSRRYVVKK